MSFGCGAQQARLSARRTAPGAIAEGDRLRVVQVRELDGSGTGRAVESREQFINLAPKPGRLGRGRRIRLRARVQWLSGNQKRPVAGQRMYWYFRPGEENGGGLPLPLRAGFGKPGRKVAATRVLKSGWTEVAEFFLSQYGGDSFEVFVTQDPNCTGGVSAGRYTVWRRVYYELDCMQRSSGGTYSDRLDTGELERRFREVFVALRWGGTDGSPAHCRLLTGKTAGEWAGQVRDGGGTPRYLHFCLVDTVSSDWAELTEELELAPGAARILLPSDRYTLDAEDWFVAAEARQGSRQWPLMGSRLHLSEEASAYSIAVDLAELDVNRAEPLILTLTFTNWNESSALQAGPATLVGMRWRERASSNGGVDVENSTLRTIMRAAGRAMGMVPATLPEGTPNDNRAATGHCGSPSCVMSEASSTGTRFCPDCEEMLRARDLCSLPVSPSAPY